MSTKYISTEVEVGLEEWRDDELIKEIKARGYKVEDDEDLEDDFSYESPESAEFTTV
jgi:hypothetical protein